MVRGAYHFKTAANLFSTERVLCILGKFSDNWRSTDNEHISNSGAIFPMEEEVEGTREVLPARGSGLLCPPRCPPLPFSTPLSRVSRTPASFLLSLSLNLRPRSSSCPRPQLCRDHLFTTPSQCPFRPDARAVLSCAPRAPAQPCCPAASGGPDLTLRTSVTPHPAVRG